MPDSGAPLSLRAFLTWTDAALRTSEPSSTSPKQAPYPHLFPEEATRPSDLTALPASSHQKRTGCPASPIPAARPGRVPSQATSWCTGIGQGEAGPCLCSPPGVSACHTLTLSLRTWVPAEGLGQASPERAPALSKRTPTVPRCSQGRASGPYPPRRWGGRPGCAPRAGHQASPPLLSAPGPPPPPRSRSRSWSRGGGGTRPAGQISCSAADGGRQEPARAASGTHGLCASPRPFFAPGRDSRAPRRTAGGRPGDAEPPRQPDLRDRTGPPEVSARVRAGTLRSCGGPCAPGGPSRPRTLPRPPPREGGASPRLRVPTLSPPPPRRAQYQRLGTA